MPRAARPRLETGESNLVGPRVRERRVELGLTHDSVCGRLAYLTNGRWIPNRQDIYKIEAQVRTCTDIEMVAIAGALETSAAWLLIGNDAVSDPLR